MAVQKLQDALEAVDWNDNVQTFIGQADRMEELAAANLRLALWAHQLESADSGNAALSFIRELQMAGQHVAVLIGLGLYKPAAASMRTAVESALYYTYFRDHPSELRTLVRDSTYYVAKRDIVDYHKLHTPKFKQCQAALGLISRLDSWYSQVSAIVHGQIPGSWLTYTSIKNVAHDQEALGLAVASLIEAEELIRRLLLCTSGQQLWANFSTPAKKQFLKGLTGPQKDILGLDQA